MLIIGVGRGTQWMVVFQVEVFVNIIKQIINWYKYTRRGIVDSYCTKYDWLIEIRTGINDHPISCISYPPILNVHNVDRSSSWFFYTFYQGVINTPDWRIGTRGICNHYNAK